MGTKGKLTVIAVLMSGIVALLVWSKNGERKKPHTPQNAVTNGAIDSLPGNDDPGARVINENADPTHSPTGPGNGDGSIPTDTAGSHNEQPAPHVADSTPPVRPESPIQTGRTYTVAAGDSLWKIAQKVYGKGTEGRRIFDANRDKMSSEDDFLRVGTVLAIPALPEAVKPAIPETVDAGVAPKNAPADGVKTPAAAKTYKVKAGDTLSSIAKSTLGDGNKWKEIFKANKDRLAHPDSLTEGMELSIPETH